MEEEIESGEATASARWSGQRILDDADLQRTVLAHHAERLCERLRAEPNQLG